MPFNVKASRLETFHDACQGRTLTFEAALTSDDLELVDAAAWDRLSDVVASEMGPVPDLALIEPGIRILELAAA